tara:strand:- start:917 stop:1780 length:864 start_codon:yes stop_codon:yes gene_type:complete
MKNRILNATLGYLIEDANFDWNAIKTYIDELDIEIEVVKLKEGLGFANDKVYIDLLECYRQCKGDKSLVLFVLLHEVGHMKRINTNPELKNLLETSDFDAYFESVITEEHAANEYAKTIFKELTGIEPNNFYMVSEIMLRRDTYKARIKEVFNKKQELGSWKNFTHDYLIDRDYVWRTKDLSWNTMHSEEERMVRCCINGDFYNPFDPELRKSNTISANPFSFDILRMNGGPIDDYSEKDVTFMNPFNSRYISKASYENGELIEAYEVIDNEWVGIDLNQLKEKYDK